MSKTVDIAALAATILKEVSDIAKRAESDSHYARGATDGVSRLLKDITQAINATEEPVAPDATEEPKGQ